MVCIQTFAVPANPNPVTVTQPNGEEVTLIMKGDEFINWAVTLDGYTLLVNSEFYFAYAQHNASGNMEPSPFTATEISNRPPEVTAWLQSIGTGVFYSNEQVSYYMQLRAIAQAEGAKGDRSTTGEQKLLVMLVQFPEDATVSPSTARPMTKTQEDFDMLLNQINYNEGSATGSVKDFFLEASYNKLDLTCTVTGPYTLPRGATFYAPEARWNMFARNTIQEVNKAGFDFSEFVIPGTTNQIHSIYIIYAGADASSGASNAIWAHAQRQFNWNEGGYLFQRYACSSELRGSSHAGSSIADIGTFCHEYGHSLNAPDYYDTNYETGGEYQGTGYWDLQASGSHNNSGRTPAPPNPRSKVYTYGWATANELNTPQTVTIPIARIYDNAYFRINTHDPNQYFIIENKLREGFDVSIPGENLLIYRATEPYDGTGQTANTTSPQRFFPVAANAPVAVPEAGTNKQAQYGSINSGSCPWPGTQNKTTFSSTTTPAMVTWDGTPVIKPITNITVHDDYITFDFMGGGSKSNHHVFLPAYYGCIVTAQPGSSSPVNQGGSFSFSIDVLPTHNNSNLVVTANHGEPITPSGGVYTISNIQADQIVRIEGLKFNTFPITVTAGTNGTVIPGGENGIVLVNQNAKQTFEIRADNGYSIDKVIVDGTDMGLIRSHTFENVNEPHSISATFKLGGQYTINVDPGSLRFETYAGVASDYQIVTVSSLDVTSNISVVAPGRFQISHNGTTWTQNFTIARTQLPYKLYVRFDTPWGQSGTWEKEITLKATEAFNKIDVTGLAYLGIEDMGNDQNIVIYPNPTTGELKIENGELKIENVEIYDVYGRRQKIILNSQFSILNSIDISHLSAGIYFIQIETEKETITKKVVKE